MNLLSQLKKVLYITIAWTLVALFINVIGMSAVLDRNVIQNVDPTELELDYYLAFFGSIIESVIGGLVGGSAIVFVWEKWLRSKPYGWTLKNIVLSFVIIFIITAIPVILFNNTYNNDVSVFSKQAWLEVLEAFQTPSLLIPFFFWMAVVIMTFIFLQVNDKYGPGVFKKFLLGKYFHPTREERIFMFLDLRSSTAIAEKLGEEKYFNFIREVFKIVTPAILKNEGEIYQYVGDEIVISWPMNEGLKNASCVRTYSDVESSIKENIDFFISTYGVEPEFKAGVHGGYVMAGELGIVKREIAYSGDVLNTAARIQAMCNELKVNLLVSGEIVKALKQDNFQSKGFINLRGKSERMELFTI
ncbi:MAG: adenylate/guanylate cyclase domain-containing protein [Fulvivirga sp.]|uniref:adenylate/guanylate cyclase domain-containing protein n=1 Tax=Fulvivirga sp. TaxID=1931237 RepID=UPI0032ED0D73